MSNASMFYREIPASSEISHLVLSFWEFLIQGENHEPIVHEVFPTAVFHSSTKEIEFSALTGFSHTG